jgi:predicted Zn-dependent protease
VEKARDILEKLDKAIPGSSYVKLRRANLERRSEEIPNACAIYEQAIAESTDAQLITFYSIKYAKFLSKVRHKVFEKLNNLFCCYSRV